MKSTNKKRWIEICIECRKELSQSTKKELFDPSSGLYFPLCPECFEVKQKTKEQ